ncbi:MAG: DegV family protein [Anaerolineaceae bacterium]|nr:DegV family protein [bacterium]MBQ4513609.1 DegV family protein [Anaerolineaceae bacterium]
MIRIFGDTTSGMTLEQAKDLGIEYIPQLVIFGEETYRDDTEIDSATFVRKLKESTQLPKTAAPPPSLYTPIYQDMLEKGDSGIIICPSSQLSGTVRSALTALEDYPDLDVRVIDSKQIGSIQAELLKMAKQWADEGKSLDEIENLVNEKIAHAKIYAVVDTLEYLYKGGRIGGASKLLGDVLQIKPILSIVNGRVESFEKQRTKKKALARLVELVETECKDYKEGHFSFSTTADNPDIPFLENEFKTKFGAANIPCLNLPPAIMVHAGPATIIVSFFSE